MTLLLRAIRKGRWLDAVGLDWLEEDDVAADPLADLTTRQNTLSVWERTNAKLRQKLPPRAS